MNYKDLQDKIYLSAWDDKSKETINTIAPKLGRRLLGYLILITTDVGSYFQAEKITEAVKMVSGWNDLLQKSGSHKIVSQILSFWPNSDSYSEKVMFYAIMDLRANNALNQNITDELSRLFNLISCIYFEKLLMKEVSQMLKNDAASVASFADLSEEIKRYYYLKDLDSTQLAQLKTALEQNTEEIGGEPLKLVNGTTRPAVANWFKAFAENRALSGLKGSYNIAYFVTNYPPARKLSDGDRAVIADLLRLYSWLMAPDVYADEMNHYNQERNAYYQSVKKDLLDLASTEIPESSASLDAVAPMKSIPEKTNLQLGGVALEKRDQRDLTAVAKPFASPEPSTDIGMQMAQDIVQQPLGGLAMNEGTNIQIDAETKRLQQERDNQLNSIQKKLEELRKRNNTN